MTERVIDGFSRWFASAGAVWQTLIFCFGLVVAEAFWPQIDPHNFHYLYALTLYSAVTQPALAYASHKAANEAEKARAGFKALMESQGQLLINQVDMMKTLILIAEEIKITVEEQEEMLEDIERIHTISGEILDARKDKEEGT